MTSLSPWQSPTIIPEKVLLEIFAHAYIEENVANFKHSFSISRVCQYWRRVAVSNPALWTDIDFRNKKLAELALSRTNWDTPLDLRLIDLHTPEVDSEIYDFVKQNWSRVNVLAISPWESDVDSPAILQFFVDNPPPPDTVKGLFIFADSYYEEEPCSDDESDYERETPPPPPADRKPVLNLLACIETLSSVREVALSSIEIPTWSPLYDNLVLLDLCDFRPLVPVHQILDVCRRSPRLHILKLDDVIAELAPEEHVETPRVELPELSRILIISKGFRSTVYLLEHIVSPSLDDISVHVSSDGSGVEIARVLAPLQDYPLVRSMTGIILHDTFEDGTALSSYGPGETHSGKLLVEVDNCSWDSQCAEPAFVDFMPKTRKVKVSGDCAAATKMLYRHNIEELVLWSGIALQVIAQMAPGGSLQGVRTVEMDGFCRSERAEVLDALGRTKSLRLLRLLRSSYVRHEDVRLFMEFGIKHGVWVKWIVEDELPEYKDSDDEYSEEEPTRPIRRNGRAFAFYDMDDDSEDDMDVMVGSKRPHEDDEEKSPTPNTPPKKVLYDIPLTPEEISNSRIKDPLFKQLVYSNSDLLSTLDARMEVDL